MNKFSFVELAILQMLATTNLHGYAMTAKMRACSDGSLSLPAGSLYPALHKLERAGLISSSIDDTSGRRRRTYALTAKGSKVLEQEITSWRAIVKTMDVLLGAA